MLILPIHTPLLRSGDDLAEALKKSGEILAQDILILSSKAVATVENAAIDLHTLKVTTEARDLAQKSGRSEAFMQAVLGETKRMNGRVMGSAPGAVLTELKPKGFSEGTLLVPNAGLDESNIADGWTVGWPVDPVESIRALQQALGAPLVLTDSCCIPRRRGVTAFAMACAGIDPFHELQGKEDLFGKKMRITVEAVADQLATAGNFVMGNAAASVPAVIIREHGLPSSSFCGWVPAMDAREDLFKDVFKAVSFER